MSLRHKGWPPFIPAILDDTGFSPVEFRIICRIARRAGKAGLLNESAENIAAGCRVHRDTVFDAIKRLVGWRVLNRRPVRGQPTEYTLNPPNEWAKPVGNEGAGVSESKGLVDVSEKEGRNLPESKGHKGYPSKGRRTGKTAETFRQPGEAVEEIDVPTY